MVTLGKFQHNLLIHNSVVPQQQHLLQFPSKIHLSFPTRLDFNAAVGKLQNGFFCSAAKTKKKKGGSSTPPEIDVADEIEVEIDGAGEFDDEFDDEFSDFEEDGEFDGGEDEEDDDEEVFVPLENMKKWLASRPSGFGEGKTYDTSVEDKLVEELEQSRKAQLANLNKLKHGSVNPNPKKVTTNQDKGSAQDGFRVRLVNLPKKKNIHRDLQLAFKGTPGLLSIVPVVAGNEKTRDPVCKGIAFVDFKYQDEAQRFVENYSGRSISYGKVQKQLTCEMVNPSAPKKSAIAKTVDAGNRTPRKPLLKLSEELDDVLETDVPLLRSLEETVPNELDGEWEDDDDNDDDDDDDEEINATSAFDSAVIPSSSKKISKIEKKEKKAASKTKKEGVPKIKKINATSAFDGSNTVAEEIDGDSVVSSSSSKQTSKIDKSEKKAAASKTKKNKNIPKTKNILGSATRLKVRDKAVLTGVLSKYGAKATLAVKEQAR
ncbi:hypothetical protein ABFS83_12G113700 [Erythranthe nasuta]